MKSHFFEFARLTLWLTLVFPIVIATILLKYVVNAVTTIKGGKLFNGGNYSQINGI